MSIQIPDNPTGPDGYYPIPPEYTAALDKAKQLLIDQTQPDTPWQDAGVQEEVTLSRIDNAEDPADVPWVKGVTTVEQATPAQLIATIQLPGMRKKWDPRFDFGHPIQRYDPETYLFYSVTKSPSYFIWARDIGGVQRNVYDYPSKGDITILQTSVDNDEFFPDAGSYAKSRTRATAVLSAWIIKPSPANPQDVELTYIVKVHLNGALPTAIVSALATETPMCVGRVRDTYYTTGFAPYVAHRPDASANSDESAVVRTMDFDDDDGVTRKWTGHFLAKGAKEETLEIVYDAKRMYADGIEHSLEGEAASEVKLELVEGEGKIKVTIPAEAKGKKFSVIITPK